MKQLFLLIRSISYLLILILATSCAKDTVSTQQPCPTCTQHPTRVISVVVDNWVNQGNGRYTSDLYAIVKKYTTDFTTISDVFVNSGQHPQDLKSGSSMVYSGGELTSFSSSLYYSQYSINGQYPQLAVESLSLSVTIN